MMAAGSRFSGDRVLSRRGRGGGTAVTLAWADPSAAG
jgi:hypothetical protein